LRGHGPPRGRTTGTQKIQKHTNFPSDVDPRTLPSMIDLRDLKKRGTVAAPNRRRAADAG
jgi:hypothetical protein